jgi:5-methylcytosine-specific restriction protein A
MDWVIYVPKSARKNLEIGLKKGVWGHKDIFSTVNTDKVKEGDTLYFVEYLKLLTIDGIDKVKGFPRVDAVHYNGVIHSLSKCTITSKMYHSEELVWPDDIYPHRYSIKPIKRTGAIPFGHEFFTSHFVECVRESTLRKGSAIELNELKGDIYAREDLLDIEVSEGKPVYKNHIHRERNQEIVRLKKESVLKSQGNLICEVCQFDFHKNYGSRGENYIECHHDNPLSANNGSSKTKLKDLSLLCANCHTMIHRFRPWLSVKELKEMHNG